MSTVSRRTPKSRLLLTARAWGIPVRAVGRILRCGEHERVLQGGVPDATNNTEYARCCNRGLRALSGPAKSQS